MQLHYLFDKPGQPGFLFGATMEKTKRKNPFDMSEYFKSHSFTMKDPNLADAAADVWRKVPHAKVLGPYGENRSYHVWLKKDLLTTGNPLTT